MKSKWKSLLVLSLMLFISSCESIFVSGSTSSNDTSIEESSSSETTYEEYTYVKGNIEYKLCNGKATIKAIDNTVKSIKVPINIKYNNSE
ncbi:MAG: hypothetical protein SOU19_05050 [Candidatus Caccosoma sp.]|nr:hypothetical protein [Candidatus Caccosoma sp.]